MTPTLIFFPTQLLSGSISLKCQGRRSFLPLLRHLRPPLLGVAGLQLQCRVMTFGLAHRTSHLGTGVLAGWLGVGRCRTSSDAPLRPYFRVQSWPHFLPPRCKLSFRGPIALSVIWFWLGSLSPLLWLWLFPRSAPVPGLAVEPRSWH